MGFGAKVQMSIAMIIDFSERTPADRSRTRKISIEWFQKCKIYKTYPSFAVV